MTPARTRLSPDQRALRDQCIETVKAGLKGVFDWLGALIQLKEDRLYLETHDNFDDFCQEELGLTRQHVYRLISAAEVKASLPRSAANLITNERQARALSDVPEDQRVEVLKDIKKSGEPITESTIQEASNKLKMSPTGDKVQPIKPGKSLKRPDEFDDAGTVIPDEAIIFWRRRQEVQDLLSQISRIKGIVERAKESDDRLYAKVSSACIADLSKAYTHLSEAKPYAVCTNCQGSPSAQPKGCEYCGGSGMVSKFRWDTASRQEVKEMRAKVIAARVAA